MKKVLLYIGCIVSVISLITTIVFGIFVYFTNKNVDYAFDEMLFRKALEEDTVYYYAYDKNGTLNEVWKNFGKERREWVSIQDTSDNLINGFIAAEDREFYSHKGINIKRTFAAVVNHIVKTRDSFGASTITQQVIKNISGDNEATVKRKVNEIFRAINLEKHHSKDEIMEIYLNIVPMSDNIYGVSAAAEAYFSKDASELTVAEAATIIGITNAPSKYNPYVHPDACLAKRNRVLYAMLQNGAISETVYETACESPLGIVADKRSRGVSSWFVETATDDVLADIEKTYAVSAPAARMMLKGAKIILTMSPEIQSILEEYFYDESNLSDKLKYGLDYSMIISDPYTGNLLGIIGNGGKKDAEKLLNHALTPVTPGSCLKPLAIYAPLLDQGVINWSGMVTDEPIRYINISNSEIPYPKNTPDIYEGDISISEAIKRSKNTVAIKLLHTLGIERAYKLLEDEYGFENLTARTVSDDGHIITDLAEAPLALGQLSKGESLRKITESYNVFPNGGVLKNGASYHGVYDKNGNEIVKPMAREHRIFREDTAKIMNQLLMNVVNDGTAKQITLKENIDTAGKTGTSGGDKDRLFVGYTPYYTAGIWCGFSGSGVAVGNNSPNHLQIWDRIMTKIHDTLVFDNFSENVRCFDTSGLLVQPYCSLSGDIPGEFCELDDEMHIEYGYYSKDNIPQKVCDIHG